MSDREKKLLLLFLGAGFLVLNVLGYTYFQTTKASVDSRHAKAKQGLMTARQVRASSAERMEQIEWLNKHEPKPSESQDVRGQLYNFCISQARLNGLTFEEKHIEFPSVDNPEANHFHRTKVRMKVTGPEQAFYTRLYKINVPTELRHATRLELKPSTKDDTQIDATVTIEQWFVPPPPSA